MKHEKDYLMREVARLTLFLQTLLSGLKQVKEAEFEEEFSVAEAELKREFGFSFSEIAQLEEKYFQKLIAELPQVHLELWIALLAQCINQIPTDIRALLAVKGAAMITYLNQHSKTFSFERNSFKAVFERHLAE